MGSIFSVRSSDRFPAKPQETAAVTAGGSVFTSASKSQHDNSAVQTSVLNQYAKTDASSFQLNSDSFIKVNISDVVPESTATESEDRTEKIEPTITNSESTSIMLPEMLSGVEQTVTAVYKLASKDSLVDDKKDDITSPCSLMHPVVEETTVLTISSNQNESSVAHALEVKEREVRKENISIEISEEKVSKSVSVTNIDTQKSPSLNEFDDGTT